ncbi:hypothetical protein J3E68DRAFT_92175 [Trichoderma sp. SZMC 28012]
MPCLSLVGSSWRTKACPDIVLASYFEVDKLSGGLLSNCRDISPNVCPPDCCRTKLPTALSASDHVLLKDSWKTKFGLAVTHRRLSLAQRLSLEATTRPIRDPNEGFKLKGVLTRTQREPTKSLVNPATRAGPRNDKAKQGKKGGSETCKTLSDHF